ncbi:MAG: Type IV pilus inner membrane protein PilC [candidate division TM6 bacterium GW2011_GWF2_37_49]|nr:MAG: Type IV pilus inner membrane protein PilC [candidate division TM6 bacterium GW2011_GWF2_37_49]
MPLYQYESFSRRGNKVVGTIDAPSLAAAKDGLQGQGLMPINIYEVSGEGQGGFSLKTLFEKPTDLRTIVLFTKQLAVLLKSAVPLLQALELLVDQFDGAFKRILIRVKDGLKSGQPFAKELSRYPKVFTNVYVQLIRAGEASGKLETILFRLTEYLEKSEETKKKVKKAMSYPIMMLSFSVLIVVALLVVLVPKLKSMFVSMGKELPLPTRILIVASDFFTNNYTLLGVTVIGGIILFSYWKSTPSGKHKFDEFLLWLPMTAYFSRTKAVVQFSKTLGMLLESGVNLSEALDIVCNIVDNTVLVKQLNMARDKIIKEGKISKYLRETGIFPNIASW